MKLIVAVLVVLLFASEISWGKKYHTASRAANKHHVSTFDWQAAKERSRKKEAKVALGIGIAGFVLLFFVCPYMVVKAIKENRKLRAYEFNHTSAYGVLQFSNFIEAEAHRKKKDAIYLQFVLFGLLTIPAMIAMVIGFSLGAPILGQIYF